MVLQRLFLLPVIHKRDQYISKHAFKSRISLNCDIRWGNLIREDIEQALSVFTSNFSDEGVVECLMAPTVLEWRLYCLHKSALNALIAKKKPRARGKHCSCGGFWKAEEHSIAAKKGVTGTGRSLRKRREDCIRSMRRTLLAKVPETHPQPNLSP